MHAPLRLRALPLVCVLVLATGCTTNELGRLSASETGNLSLGDVPRARFDAEQSAACGAAASSDAITRAPYLQQVTPTSALVLFAADSDDYQVRVRRAGGDAVAHRARLDRVARPVAGRQYQAAVDGLEADTLYCYRVVAGDRPVAGPFGFRTAPADPSATVRFAALSDLGTRTGDQFAVREALEDVPLDFVLIGGDIAYSDGTRREFEDNFFSVYAELLARVPFYVTSGNHDLRTEDGAPLREFFALPDNGGAAGLERWYSFDYGPVHVVMLDAEKVGAAQIRWLDNDLARADRPWTVAVVHRPPYSSGWHGSNPEVRDGFVPVFRRHGVDLVLSGDDHNYERTTPQDGVTYVVTGGGGRGTRPVTSSDFTAFSLQVSHFVHLVANDRRLELRAVDATGRVFDTVLLRR